MPKVDAFSRNVRFKKKALSRVAGQPAGEIRDLPAPTQEKEGGLTNSMDGSCQQTFCIKDTHFIAKTFEKSRVLCLGKEMVHRI